MIKKLYLVVTLTIVCTKANPYWTSSKNLQPVQGLYVKPSLDGTTGDLYVAASEDNGVHSQWVADQPINYLPVAAQPQATGYPIAYPTSYAPATLHHEDANPQKRAIVSSPAVQYAYALPGATSEVSTGQVSYPYGVAPIANPAVAADTSSDPHCTEGAVPTATYPYSPYQYFYPYLMAAAAASNANALKQYGLSDELAATVASQATASMWSPSYAYPMQYNAMQYMMMDPSVWAQSAAAATAAEAAAATTKPAAETDEHKE